MTSSDRPKRSFGKISITLLFEDCTAKNKELEDVITGTLRLGKLIESAEREHIKHRFQESQEDDSNHKKLFRMFRVLKWRATNISTGGSKVILLKVRKAIKSMKRTKVPCVDRHNV